MTHVQHISIRVPPELRDRIQQLAQHWPGSPSESYMIRYLIELSLDKLERDRMGTP